MQTLLILLALGMGSCTKQNCADPASVASMLTGALAAVGSCNTQGAALIKADVSSVAGKLNLCQNGSSGLFATLICGPAINGLASLAGGSLDSRYIGCNFSALAVAPTTALVALCSGLPF